MILHYIFVIDVFLLPSIYEGLGLVLVEAQANGLSCAADVVPAPDLIGRVKKIELARSDEGWAEEIIGMPSKRWKMLKKSLNMADMHIVCEAKGLENFCIQTVYEKITKQSVDYYV